MDSRRDHAWLMMRQQRRMNAARREMATAITQAVMTRCGERETYDVGCHLAVMRDVDAVITRYYGRNPLDERAILLGVITASTREGYELLCKRMRQLTTRHLSRFAPDVLQALRERARAKDEE